MFSNLKTEPLPHQVEGALFHLTKKYSGNFGEMGTGKSLAFLAAVVALKNKDPNVKALVACPPYLVNNWINEVTKHTHLKPSPHFQKIDESADVYIIPYTQLAKVEELFKLVTIVGGDEAHYLKNLDAKRTRMFHFFMGKYTPEYFVYMTGTPIKNRIPEIYSMLMLFCEGPNLPKILDHYKSFYTFCCRFTNVKETPFGNKYEGMKNVEELRRFVNPFVIRHGSEVLNLPELSQTSVVVSYNDNPELDAAFERFTDSAIGAEITVKRDSAVAKAVYTAEYIIEAIESGCGPVVVFSDHKKPLEIMGLALSKLRVAIINGDVPSNNRQVLVDQLNRGQLDVLLCTFGAASTGYNMTGANLLVVNDPPWVVADLQQAMKRIHRMGQTRLCRIVHVIGSKVDENILKKLRAKEKVIKAVINDR